MNVNHILTQDYIEINGYKIFIGNSFKEIETKIKSTLFISQKNNDSTIVSEGDFQLHFKENLFYMWTISPYKSFLFFDKTKRKLNGIKFNQFLKILFKEKIKWEFNQELTFSDQISIQLENKVNFIFRFDEKNRKGHLGKIGLTKQL
ncbi:MULTISPECIES: hypothetical protein [unclassified Tenacibaculum]|uniref:hypothetical protein n=1 Tax=unclassified Tenacibaculum TaxID=2635139 RepID=UPI001F2E0125|nr:MULTISPECIES: hypothetical protein [unclassified Tenacibaculum]MCF2875191.1 hypothetical protein [Tenacibaculum sp. Cn5-1]MCF2935267.1 hypothetical protein [Tenacibaculum sp. Cn5-34]MCG7511291.1 hypothetical protein [Tenacibaculum sp. Cn5-46]